MGDTQGLQFCVGFVELEVTFHFSILQVLVQFNAVLLNIVHLGLYLVHINNQGFWYNHCVRFRELM
jgi:hypothetical protein